MKSRDRRSKLAREALRLAPGRDETDVSHLIEAVPDLMAEARRRRSVPARPDLGLAIAARARQAVPKLAAVTVFVVLLSIAATLLLARSSPGGGSMSVESVILAGPHETDSSDVLLEAVMSSGKNRG
jgi:hypothetical protein